MQARLFRNEVLPFVLTMGALVVSTLLIDAALHLLNIVWIGRWLGIPGVLLIIGSFGYSMRKRKLIQSGQPATLLRWHEGLAWLGSLLVLVHAGIHFNAILLTGKLLMDRSRQRLEEARQRMRDQGLPAEELADRTYWDSLTFDAVKKWRVIHFPITLAFGVLGLAHIIATLLFWGWK